MSLKSQKSLNDECSEITDKSYSVTTSESEESISGDEDEHLAKELINVMTPAFLSKLRRCFKKYKERTTAKDLESKVEEVMRRAAAEEGIEFPVPGTTQDALSLDEGSFVTAINNIFGHHKYATHAKKLFRVLDPYNAGRAKWRQLVAKLEQVGAKKTGSKKDLWNRITCGDIIKLEHCKRETIVKLVNIEREDAFCYVAVSKGGRVGIYCDNFNILHSYEVFYHRTGLRRRVKNCWITDALYLSDVQYLMYAASDRSLTVYDATTLSHTPLYCITGMPNIPTSLSYCPSVHPGAGSELAIGTERGLVLRLRFHSPRVNMFHTKSPDSINYYFWMELSSPPHTSLFTITKWRRVHARSIRRLAHARGGDIMVSCSHDSNASVRLRHVLGKLDDYVFKVQRGVSCFHVVYPLHLVATGSVDGAVRLWETSQSTPFAVLYAPSVPAVLDVAIVPGREAVVAFCNNCTVHIWDIYEECLLQTIKIKFPFLGVLGHKVEFGAYCIHPGPIYKTLDEDLSEAKPSSSRRGSSVVQVPTGGFMLQPESEMWQKPGPQQPYAYVPLIPVEVRFQSILRQNLYPSVYGHAYPCEYVKFNRSSLVVSCCSYICILTLSERRGRAPPPPGDTLAPRRPSAWDLPQLHHLGNSTQTHTMCKRDSGAPKQCLVPGKQSPVPSSPSFSSLVSSLPSLPSLSPGLLAPSAAEFSTYELETLLDAAGLHGILEKDFVLMQGLKHDLNKKLAQMEANKESMRSAVSLGAPYLSLKTYPLAQINPVDEMMDKYKRIMKLFPGPSLAGTPCNSEMSTPRNSKNYK